MKFAPMLLSAVALLLPAYAADAAPVLWYQQPAYVHPAALPWGKVDGEANVGKSAAKTSPHRIWESQTLPVGNGRLGATIFGGDHLERLNLNESSLWTGGRNLPNNGAGYSYGPKAGKDEFGSYQPFGNLYIQSELPGKSTEYSRSLNLSTGIATIEFTNGGVHYRRECFASHPDKVLVYTMSADKEGSINAKVALAPCHDVSYSGAENTLIMRGTLANGEKFEGRVFVRVKGKKASAKLTGSGKNVAVTYEGKPAREQVPVFDLKGAPAISISKADSAELYISLATDYKMDDAADWKGSDPAQLNKKVLAAVTKKSLKDIRKSHIADFSNLFKRLSIHLGKTEEAAAKLPTDERLARYRKGGSDPELEALAYQYGRYVLISGSRPGNLPLTLQGIWNDAVHAAWACDYHNNINLQMCYWGAEVGNLSECHRTLIDYLKAMEAPLHRMTEKQFGKGTPGWTTRISQNPWGGGGWNKWNPPVNAWYALHIWDHYTFTRDKEYLKDTAYPVMKNICAFWESQLKELGADGQGLLSAGKPLSAAQHPELKQLPKGTLVAPNGWSHEWGPVEDGISHDHQLIRELFRNTANAAEELGTDSGWASKLQDKAKRLAPERVAPGGYLQEWIIDRPEMVAGHRHTSHLIGVFPGTIISPARTPELAAAAEKSLELRGMGGDNRRSWTWPWRAALWARFLKPEKAYEMVRGYLTHNVLDNLFGNHPPMQMDGTYGITGGMSELLLQSHAGEIVLLPALPEAWSEGHVRGIRARGNITVDMEWKNGKVTRYKLSTSTKNPPEVTLVVNGEKKKVVPEYSASNKKKAKKAKGKSAA